MQAFYQAANPSPPWDGWGSNDVCSWQGVTCRQADARVESLVIMDMERATLFALPTELGWLQALTTLTLDGCPLNVNGFLPSELFALSTLKHLHLHGCRHDWDYGVSAGLDRPFGTRRDEGFLSGFLPFTELGALTQLTYLNIRFSVMSGTIPSTELQRLSLLRDMHLGKQQLSGTLPSGLYDIVQLTSLRLDDLLLTGTIATELSRLTALDELHLGDSDGDSDPDQGRPGACSIRTGHECVDGQRNGLSGTLPSEVGLLTALTSCIFKRSYLSGHLPIEIFTRLSNVMHLELSHNAMSGWMPSQIGLLTTLTDFRAALLGWQNPRASSSDLQGYSGFLPPELGKLTQIEHLMIDTNSFSGTFPPELGMMEANTILKLNNCFLSGWLPTELGNLTHLRLLEIELNPFSGYVPSELGNVSSLQRVLVMGYSLLSGWLPQELGRSGQIKVLRFGNNLLSGTIPPGLFNAINTSFINGRFTIGGNPMSGWIPDGLWQSAGLVDLVLGGGFFQWWYPPTYNIEFLTYHENQFSGTIPTYVGHLTSLETLDLQINRLSGTIPSQIGRLTSLRNLYLNGNAVEGNLPWQIGDMSTLVRIDLRDINMGQELPSFHALSQTVTQCWLPDRTDGLQYTCATSSVAVRSMCLVFQPGTTVGGSLTCEAFTCNKTSAAVLQAAGYSVTYPFPEGREINGVEAYPPATTVDQMGAVSCVPGFGAASTIVGSVGLRCDNDLDVFSTYGCLFCGVGTYSASTDATLCRPCDIGTASSEEGLAQPCADCAPGTYQSSAGRTACVAAPAGQYVAARRATAPSDCEAGTSSNVTGLDRLCPKCQYGTSQPLVGQQQCEPCGRGTFAASQGLASCTPCGPGSYSESEGASSCEDCEAGEYIDAFNATACAPAPLGAYVSGRGWDAFQTCSDGEYADQSGQVSCFDCEVGRYANNTGMTACTAAPPGKYVAVYGGNGAALTACETGTYTAANGSSNCASCSPGTFADEAGQTNCTQADPGYAAAGERQSEQAACAAGRYSNSHGAAACPACAAGTFSDQTGRRWCKPAQPGQHVPSSGATTTIDCVAGRYQDESSRSVCYPCSAGTYANGTRTEVCTPAASGHVVPSAAMTEQIPCAAGAYQAQSGLTACVDCPTGRYSNTTASTSCYEASSPVGSGSGDDDDDMLVIAGAAVGAVAAAATAIFLIMQRSKKNNNASATPQLETVGVDASASPQQDNDQTRVDALAKREEMARLDALNEQGVAVGARAIYGAGDDNTGQTPAEAGVEMQAVDDQATKKLIEKIKAKLKALPAKDERTPDEAAEFKKLKKQYIKLTSENGSSGEAGTGRPEPSEEPVAMDGTERRIKMLKKQMKEMPAKDDRTPEEAAQYKKLKREFTGLKDSLA